MCSRTRCTVLLRSPLLRHPTVAGLLPVASQGRNSGASSFNCSSQLNAAPQRRHVKVPEKAQIALITVLPMAKDRPGGGSYDHTQKRTDHSFG